MEVTSFRQNQNEKRDRSCFAVHLGFHINKIKWSHKRITNVLSYSSPLTIVADKAIEADTFAAAEITGSIVIAVILAF